MKSLFVGVFGIVFLSFSFSQPVIFDGRVDLSSGVASFASDLPREGTLYLLDGAAENVRLVSTEPWTARVVCLKAVWQLGEKLQAFRVEMVFRGEHWKGRILDRWPGSDTQGVIYPHVHFQAFATYAGHRSPEGFLEFDVKALR